MANVIRQLAVELRLQAENFNSGIKTAAREAKEFERNLKPTTQLLGDMGKAASVAGLAIVGAFALAVKSAADYGDEINDAAKRTGVTTENLSKLRLAAETSGSSFEGLSTGLKFLGKNMELANAGSKEQIAAFKQAGISSKDLVAAHGDVNVILRKLADTFAGAEDGAGKTALSMKLLGKSGTDLIPMLNEGSAGLTKWGDEAERAGRVVSTEAAAAADEFNDALALLEGSIKGLSGTIGTALIPKLTEWVKEGTRVIQQVREWTAENKALSDGLLTVGAAIGIGGTIAGGLAILPGLLAKVRLGWAALTGALSASTLGIGALIAAIVVFRKEISVGLTTALGIGVMGLEKFTGAAAAVADKMGLTGLGGKLHDASFSLGTFREELAASVTAMIEGGKETEKAADRLKAEAEAAEKAAAAAEKNRLALEGLGEAHKALKDAQEKAYKSAFDASEKAMDAMREDGENSIHYWTKIYQASLEAKIKALGTIISILDKNREDVIRGLSEEPGNAAGLARDTAAYKKSLDDQVDAKTDAIAQIRKQEKDNADYLRKAYQDTFNSVKSTATKIFSDMIQDGKFKFSSLATSIKGIFNTLWTEILSTMTAKLLTPLVNAISNSMSGALGKIPGLGGIFGGATGPGIGSLFKSGGALASIGGLFSGGGGAAGSIGTINPGTGALVMGGGAVSAGAIAATAGIAAAVVAAIAIVKSQAHHEATTFVKTFQDPFGKAIGAVSNAFASAEAAGNLTIDAAKAAKSEVEDLWKAFQQSTADFAKGGSDEALVAKQALATLSPLMLQIFSDMDKSIGNLTTGAASLQAITEDLALTQDFIKRVTESTVGSGNLEQALSALEGMKSPVAIILDRLGSDIENFYNVLTKSGLAVPELIQKYHDLAAAQNVVAETAATLPGAQGGGPYSRITATSSEEVRAFLLALRQPQTLVLNVDGQKVATLTAPHSLALARNQGVKIVGTR